MVTGDMRTETGRVGYACTECEEFWPVSEYDSEGKSADAKAFDDALAHLTGTEPGTHAIAGVRDEEEFPDDG